MRASDDFRRREWDSARLWYWLRDSQPALFADHQLSPKTILAIALIHTTALILGSTSTVPLCGRISVPACRSGMGLGATGGNPIRTFLAGTMQVGIRL